MLTADDLTICGNRDFLEAIFADIRPDERIWTAQFKTPPDQANRKQWAGLPVSQTYLNQHPSHVGWNHYFSVAALKADASGDVHRRGECFSRLMCLVLDDASAIPGIEPTWVLETSLKADGTSNTQIGYRLTTPVDDLDLATYLHVSLKNSGHIVAVDKNGNNPVRYVRLPWGWNTKIDPPHKNRLLYWSPQTTTSVETLAAALNIDLSAVPASGASLGESDGTRVGITDVIPDDAEWKPKARKLAWDGALRTHNDPTLGRNAEIYRLGTYAARDRLPEAALEFVLQEFVAQMRPTNTSGKTTGVNWDNERATIRRGYAQGHKDGITTAVDSKRMKVKGVVVSISGANAPSLDPLPLPEPPKPYLFPRHLLAVPGLVGAVADYINASALYPQPILALAASLAFCGAIFGRKFATASDLRTNIYIIGVADSSSGKEHARKAIKRLAVAADAVAFVGAEKIASDQGLFALLSEQPSCLCLLDEFGRTLRVLNNDRAPAHLAQLVTTLLELTGSADSYIMEKRRAEHGAEHQPRVIDNPNLCLYATTVPGRLYQGLTPDEIIDGFLPRWLVFETDTPDPEMSTTLVKAPPKVLVERVSELVKLPYTIDIETKSISPRVVTLDPGAEALFAEHYATWRMRKQQARGTGLDALWGRAYEHAFRLALIVGAGADGVITADIAQWACELVEFLLTRTAEQALANVATNDHESAVQKVQAFILARGQTTMRDLSRAFRWLKQKERDGIIGTLLDAQLIEMETVNGNNRPTVVIRTLKDDDESRCPSVVPVVPNARDNGTDDESAA